LLHALHNGNAEESTLIRRAIDPRTGRALLEQVVTTRTRGESLAYTDARAEEETDKAIAALSRLPDSL
ncbi:octaprenyl diphosphate synthase, partial [Morganella morganii]|nr:octaprenyl diphosphate synthase [Morganella morganii]